jgi:aspartate dehydrogenase
MVHGARHDALMSSVVEISIAIVGLGAIGRALASAAVHGRIEGVRLGAVAVRDGAVARAWLDSIGSDAPVFPIAELADIAPIIVECAPASLFREIAEPALARGRRLVVLSVGALLEHEDLIGLARDSGGRIIVPSGALLGLDAVCAAAQGTINSVHMITRKPVQGLLGAPYLVERGIDITRLNTATKLFVGSAREAAKGFPANLNVAVALSLAGIGADRTTLEIWADPQIERNTHRIIVDADSASFDMTIANIPSENPKTGRITALSVIACLRRMGASLVVGG